MTTAKLYYEAHVTIDPVPEDQRPKVELLAHSWQFKLAKLFMDKGVPSQLGTFLTGHGKDLEGIKLRTRELVLDLQKAGYKVRRYKVEGTVLDSRSEDIFNLLK